MSTESFGERLRKGDRLLGSWSNFASFSATELMARVGFDFIVVDTQHGEVTPQHFPALLGAFAGGGALPVVRVPKNDSHVIGWLLDQGAPSIMVPLVNSAAEARLAVEHVRLPPAGKRSFGPVRAARYGMDLAGFAAGVERDVTLIVQVEDAAAARAIDEILAVPGIDAVFLGPNDIALSLLNADQSFAKIVAAPAVDGKNPWVAFSRTPEVMGLCEEVMRKCLAAKIPFGMTSATIEEARGWLERGASFTTLGSDFFFMRTGAEKIAGVKPR